MIGRLICIFVLALGVIAAQLSLQPLPAQAQESVNVGVGVGDTVLELSGLASPDAFITVSNSTGVIGTFTAGSDGSFSQTFPAQTPGITELTLTARDAAGRLTDTISLQVNLQQHFPTAVYVFMPPTLSIEAVTITNNRPLLLNGYTVPGNKVNITIDNRILYTVVVQPDGSWNLTLDTSSLSPGPHEVFARTADGAGSQSYPTSARVFTIIRDNVPRPPFSPNTQPISNLFVRPVSPRITSPTAGQKFNQNRITIVGQAQPNSQIEVWDENTVLGSVWSDMNGNWNLPYTFAAGTQTIRARACLNQLCGAFSERITFTTNFRATIPSKLQADLERYSFTASRDRPITLKLNILAGEAPLSALVDWGDGQKQNFTVSKELLLTHSYSRLGRYSGRVVVQDRNGSRELRFAVHVQEVTPSNYPLIAGVAAAAVTTIVAGAALLHTFGSGLPFIRHKP